MKNKSVFKCIMNFEPVYHEMRSKRMIEDGPKNNTHTLQSLNKVVLKQHPKVHRNLHLCRVFMVLDKGTSDRLIIHWICRQKRAQIDRDLKLRTFATASIYTQSHISHRMRFARKKFHHRRTTISQKYTRNNNKYIRIICKSTLQRCLW